MLRAMSPACSRILTASLLTISLTPEQKAATMLAVGVASAADRAVDLLAMPLPDRPASLAALSVEDQAATMLALPAGDRQAALAAMSPAILAALSQARATAAAQTKAEPSSDGGSDGGSAALAGEEEQASAGGRGWHLRREEPDSLNRSRRVHQQHLDERTTASATQHSLTMVKVTSVGNYTDTRIDPQGRCDNHFNKQLEALDLQIPAEWTDSAYEGVLKRSAERMLDQSQPLMGRGTVSVLKGRCKVNPSDMIFVMDAGRMVEHGTHADLIKHEVQLDSAGGIVSGYYRIVAGFTA